MTKRQTTIEKGYELEKEFAEYLKSEMGYHKYHIHHGVKGHINSKGTEIDIVAEKPDEKGIKTKNLSIIYYIFSACFLFLGVILTFNESDLGVPLILLGFSGFIMTIILIIHSNKHNVEHCLCECKNLTGKANINQIQKLVREYQDYIATGDKELKIKYLYFVSANGFIDNALKFAIAHHVNCFEKDKNGNFVISKYWE